MKIRDMLGRNQKNKQNHHRWHFEHPPGGGSDDKCKQLDGHVEYGAKPKYYGHVPEKEGRYNCTGRWVKDY